MQLDWLTRRPIAHRGYHNAAQGVIENTLPAVEAAMAKGFGIEVDLQLAADGEAVVFHDERLERLTGGVGLVKDRTAAELAEVPFRGTQARIPTLAQLLATVNGRVPLVIEIKSHARRAIDEALTRRTVEVLAGYSGPFVCKSFDPEIVATLRQIAPELPRGIVSDDWRDKSHFPQFGTIERFALRHLLHAPRTRPHFVSYCIDNLPAPGPSLLKRLWGCPIISWTVRRPEQRERARIFADQIVFEGFDPDA